MPYGKRKVTANAVDAKTESSKNRTAMVASLESVRIIRERRCEYPAHNQDLGVSFDSWGEEWEEIVRRKVKVSE